MGLDHKAMRDVTDPYKICLTALENDPLNKTKSLIATKSRKARQGPREYIHEMEKRIFSTDPQKKTWGWGQMNTPVIEPGIVSGWCPGYGFFHCGSASNSGTTWIHWTTALLLKKSTGWVYWRLTHTWPSSQQAAPDLRCKCSCF